MATDSILGLFTTPEQYQQAQNEAALARGAQLAKLDPFQRASAQLYQGGYMAGGALGQALGAQDPVLQQLSTIKQLSSQFDTGTSGGLSAMANALREQGLIAPAFQISQKAAELRKLEAEAQAKTMERLTEQQRNAAAIADTSFQRGTPEWTEKYSSELSRLTTPNRVGALPEIAKLQQYREQLVSQFGESDPRVKEIDAAIAKSTRQGKTLEETLGTGLAGIASAMAGAQAKKAAEAGGTEVGKQTANVQGKYTALGSIKDAVDMLDKGIYSGGYGPAQELAAKYAGGLLRKDRLANTQEFRAYIGDVVIPRLQEFGGNDSVEELNYLRSVMAGDTSMEGSAIKNILQKADRKIRAGIDRLEKQQSAITTGKPLPIGDTNATPKATKRFNPTTGQVETIK